MIMTWADRVAEPDPTQLSPELHVTRHAAYLPVSIEMLLDAGAITEAEARARGWTPPPRPSRWLRARWRWQDRRAGLRLRVGSWIAGVDLADRD